MKDLEKKEFNFTSNTDSKYMIDALEHYTNLLNKNKIKFILCMDGNTSPYRKLLEAKLNPKKEEEEPQEQSRDP